jgi:hypothetical protein
MTSDAFQQIFLPWMGAAALTVALIAGVLFLAWRHGQNH